MSITQLIWLRNDLRLSDHPAFHLAQQHGDIAIVVCLTPAQWRAHNESEAKCGLREQLINQLGAATLHSGIPFHRLALEYFSDCADALTRLCLNQGYQQVWWQNELPIDEARRDQQVQQQLNQHHLVCHRLAPDLFVNIPVLNQQNQPFKVFTAFYKRWLTSLIKQEHTPYPAPLTQARKITTAITPLHHHSYREDLWPADYPRIRQQLWHFCQLKEAQYQSTRDTPVIPGTSQLSPYLALGAIGPRECLEAIIYSSEQNQRNWHHSVWLKELAWRDFYRQLMGHFPKLCKSLPFKSNTQYVAWQSDQVAYQAWCEGRTGFPIVDAAMRQLHQTGWMHNRLRMISASFLSKLLLTDWRKGEAYFMQHLVDGEFAANNGGWQWSASCGCDAAPYFRVFNPTRQSQRFDPDGEFIQTFIPELSGVPSPQIHNPTHEIRQATGYPMPIIDYQKARANAIQAFAEIKGLGH